MAVFLVTTKNKDVTDKMMELSFSTPDDLEALVSTAGDQVAKIEKAVATVGGAFFSTINVATVFSTSATSCVHYLATVGDNLFKQPCSTEIMMDFQELIHVSALTTQSFVTASVSALKKHKMAIKAVQQDKPDVAVKMIAKCGRLAEQMAQISEDMVEKSDRFSEGLLQAVLADFGGTAEEKFLFANLYKATWMGILTGATGITTQEEGGNGRNRSRAMWIGMLTTARWISKASPGDLQEMQDLDADADEMIEHITLQAIAWCALGRVNLVAHTAMVDESAGSIDNIMRNFRATDKLLQSLKDEEPSP